tara:strand:- start:1264 stop:2415 length:1152 start_codon:yes stop_codon:yes gene_type:complete
MAAVTTLILGGIGAGLSFAQAAKVADNNREANRKAAAEMQKLKDRAEIKFTDGLTLNNDLFAQQFEQNLQVSADLINAAQEAGPREVAALAGKIGASQGMQAEAIRMAKQGRMQDIEEKQIEESSDINQQLLAIETAQLQDKTARDAQTNEAVAGATMSGITSLTSALSSAASQHQALPSKADRIAGKVFDANKSLLDKAGITREMFQLNPSKYQNIIFNSDGSNILTEGVLGATSSLTPTKLPVSSLNDADMMQSNIDEGLQTSLKYIKDKNSPFGQGVKLNPNYQAPESGAIVPPLSQAEMDENSAIQRGTGPMNMMPYPGMTGLTMPAQRTSLLQNNQTPGFRGYMGNELAALYNPEDFNQTLAKYNIDSNFDYLSFLKQ